MVLGLLTWFRSYLFSFMQTPPSWLYSLIQEEALPSAFLDLVVDYYLPLAEWIATQAKSQEEPLVVGINGAQGTGKSTMSKVLSLALEKENQLETAVISIDDIYLTHAERKQLASDVHPLLQTRGVPGTHDVAMGIDLIEELKGRQTPRIPAFNKATDDRVTDSQWIILEKPVDIILFEGWCVDAIAQPEHELDAPCNELEANEDQNAAWRGFVNKQLDQSYTQLFDLIDYLIMLKAPSFECVYKWRKTQEEKLRQTHQGDAIMDDQQVRRFIMHYERLTRWMFNEMPQRADCVLELSPEHTITEARYKK